MQHTWQQTRVVDSTHILHVFMVAADCPALQNEPTARLMIVPSRAVTISTCSTLVADTLDRPTPTANRLACAVIAPRKSAHMTCSVSHNWYLTAHHWPSAASPTCAQNRCDSSLQHTMRARTLDSRGILCGHRLRVSSWQQHAGKHAPQHTPTCAN